MKRLFILLTILIFLVACSTVPVGDTSKNALDWPGMYRCEKMTITLRANNTYKAQIGDIEIRASFHWDKREQIVCLEHLQGKLPCKRFKVGENMLIPLNKAGRPLKDAKPLLKVKKQF